MMAAEMAATGAPGHGAVRYALKAISGICALYPGAGGGWAAI